MSWVTALDANTQTISGLPRSSLSLGSTFTTIGGPMSSSRHGNTGIVGIIISILGLFLVSLYQGLMNERH